MDAGRIELAHDANGLEIARETGDVQGCEAALVRGVGDTLACAGRGGGAVYVLYCAVRTDRGCCHV